MDSVTFYADKITNSMAKTMSETERRRGIQEAYNKANGITPQAIVKERSTVFANRHEESARQDVQRKQLAETKLSLLTTEQREAKILETRKAMEAAAKDLDFIKAAQLRDLLVELKG